MIAVVSMNHKNGGGEGGLTPQGSRRSCRTSMRQSDRSRLTARGNGIPSALAISCFS